MKSIFQDQGSLFVRYQRILFLLIVGLAICGMILCSVSEAEDTPDGVQEGTIDSHPALIDSPTHTTTSSGRIGDAINVAFIGTEKELHHLLSVSGWYAADPITSKTSFRIVADVVLRKPYPHAPVSNLYLWGRKQDAAFEQPVGNSPKQRHHVRFWQSHKVDSNSKPLWLGAATYDERVELSRTTGGITHRIAPNIDQERNKIVNDAIAAGKLDGYYWVEQFHRFAKGKNGGGDPYFTDRRLAVGVIDIQR
ncbi:MAG: hypothetical protein HOH16_13200 [Planctomycetaceae bacterium]|nr:hypothetical protein [Planctomycetaceae bacterium]